MKKQLLISFVLLGLLVSSSFAQSYPTGLIVPDNPNEGLSEYISIGGELPASFNWRDQGKMTSIKNQGSCGSCWAFATLASYEAMIKVQFGDYVNNLTHPDLSEQWLIDCGPGSCSGGWEAFRTIKNQNGAISEGCYPYAAVNQTCRSSNCSYYYPLIDDYYFVSNDVDAIKIAVYNNGPVFTTVKAGIYSFKKYPAYGKVYKNNYTGTSVDHGVVICGWDDSKGSNGAWLIKNSWGTGWGLNGYMWIEYGANNVGKHNYTAVLKNPNRTVSYSSDITGENTGYARATSSISFKPGFHYKATTSKDYFSAKRIVIISTKSANTQESLAELNKESIKNNNEITIYPIPAKDIIHLNIKELKSPVDVKIIDYAGKTVLNKKVKEPHEDLDLSEFGTGIYIIKIQSEELNETKKIIIY